MATPFVLILTGAASSGKTTALNILKSKGYEIIPESAATVIYKYKKDNIPLPWEGGDWEQFQNLIGYVDRKKISLYKGKFDKIIMDRGTEDAQVYAIAKGFTVKDWKPTYEEFGIPQKNVEVYLLGVLPYQDNGIRFKISREEQQAEYDALHKIYKALNYKIYREVKTLHIDERINKIVSILNQ